jgi:hypothetical protein
VLLRAAGARRALTLAGGAALSLLTPLWLSQQAASGPAAASHVLILLAAAPSTARPRRGLSGRGALGFSALGALAAGFCLAHLTVVAAMLLSAIGAEIAQRRPAAWRRSGETALRFGLAAGVTGFMLGMRPEGPWIDAAAAYPGVAVLLLALGAAWLWRGADGRALFGDWRRYGPLALTIAALAIWGLSTAGLGTETAARFRPRSGGLEAAVYVTTALALSGLERLPPARNVVALTLAVVLQAADVSGLLAAVRPAAPQAPILTLGGSPDLEGRAFIFESSCQPTVEEAAAFGRLTLVVVRARGFVDARRACPLSSTALRPAAPLDSRVEVLPDQLGAGVLAAASRARGDCRPSGQVMLCGRNLVGAPSDLRAPQVVEFTNGRTAGLTAGWSGPEPQGVWSAQKLTGLMIRAPIFAPEGMAIDLEAVGYKPANRDSQRVIVSHENTRLAVLEIGPVPGAHRIVVPPGMARPGEAFALEFFIIDAVPVSMISPGSPDQRELGVNLRRLRITPLPSGAG